jgi:uncharacterized protein (DUF111 family)
MRAEEAENTVSVIETQLDDETGETLGGIFEPIFVLGALDVSLTPLIMKKNRPGQLLTVLCPEERESCICDCILINTSAIGLRITKAVRKCLPREIISFDTRFGRIRVKISRCGDKFSAKAEYEDARAMAEKSGVTVRQVAAAAEEAAYLALREERL